MEMSGTTLLQVLNGAHSKYEKYWILLPMFILPYYTHSHIEQPATEPYSSIQDSNSKTWDRRLKD